MLAAVAPAFIGYLRRAKHDVDKVTSEMGFQRAALSFEEFLLDWNEVNHDIQELFSKTSISRFVLLRAWNGLGEPRWTTAFFQMRETDQEPISYVHFELDDDYVSRLSLMKSRGVIHFTASQMPPSAIKSVYELEGIKSSAWFFLDRKELKGTESQSITYCSFASTTAEEISANEITRCRLIVDKMKGLI